MKKLFFIPLMLLATLMVETACSGSSGIGTSERDAATPVPDAVFEESLLLTSSTLGNMATRIPEWLESLGANREQGTESMNVRFERQ